MTTSVAYDGTAESVVDLERYPITDLAAPEAQRLVQEGRAQMTARGAHVLPELVRPHALQVAAEEARRLAAHGHHHAGVTPPYLVPPDFELPEDHPRRLLIEYSMSAVAYDFYPPDSPVRVLYDWQPLTEFVAAVLGKDALYHYADPLGALSMNVMGEGDGQGWHFDMTDFVVSLALQRSEEGGDFEVLPRIRSAEDECYDRVRAALLGDETGKLTLPMRPGTLVIFAGRYSLHRVTPIHGNTLRLVALLAYDTKRGTNSTELLKLGRYGRTE